MKNPLLLPVHLLSVFTTAKSFRNPVIGSRLLNRLGLHVGRMIAAHGIYQLRQFLLFSSLGKEDREAFDRDGFLIKNNFLPAEQYEALMSQIRDYEGCAREVKEGDTLTRRLLLSEEVTRSFPAYQELTRDPGYTRLLAYTSAMNGYPPTFLERIIHGAVDGAPDPQKALHKDTFHPTMKAWYFLEDVNPENGPFHYIPGSHRLTWRRIKWEYQESIRRSTPADVKQNALGGAFRPTVDDAEVLGLAEPVALLVKKNTLIIADTMGFHKRGSADAGQQRLAIWVNSRVNPFNPFPGFHSRFLGSVRDGIYEKYLAHLDKKAARENKTARAALVKFWDKPVKSKKGAKVEMMNSAMG
ncbi:MAG: phytanoyl-CoA dioxygenase family protein [Luteolibacter sp.]